MNQTLDLAFWCSWALRGVTRRLVATHQRVSLHFAAQTHRDGRFLGQHSSVVAPGGHRHGQGTNDMRPCFDGPRQTPCCRVASLAWATVADCSHFPSVHSPLIWIGNGDMSRLHCSEWTLNMSNDQRDVHRSLLGLVRNSAQDVREAPSEARLATLQQGV